ncbi:MAG: hypothetical protein VR67_17425 [Peptococcaceae bacterium BRH_c8a]|nr:MAG: hypothetical protein VR67_17425 [Peptococcaceae bacterium BRH_c8a]
MRFNLYQKKTDPKKTEQPDDINIFERNKLNVKDLFSSDALVEYDDRLSLGGKWCRIYAIQGLPRKLTIGFLDEIFYRAGDVDLSVHMSPAPDKEVMRSLITIETKYRSQYMLDMKSDNISRLPELEAAIADYKSIRDLIQLNQDRLYFVTILISVHANTQDELHRRCESVEVVLARMNILSRILVFRQVDGLKAVMPTCKIKIDDYWRNLTTGAAACCMPASATAVGHPSGILLGFNTSTRSPIFIDRFAGERLISNQHWFISGESGSGKSVTTRLATLRESAMGVRHVFVDPENEYVKMVRDMGGQVLRIVPGSFSGMNLLEIEPSIEENETGAKREVVNIQDKISEVQSLIAAVIKQQTGQSLGSREIAALEECLRNDYLERDITTDPNSLYQDGVKKMMPTLTSLQAKVAEKNDILADILKPMLKDGSMGMFDGQTTLKLSDAPMISFGLKSISVDFTRFFAMYTVLGWIWQKFAQKGGRAAKKSVLVDEAWMFMRYPEAAFYLEVLARRGRKHGCGLIVATQRFEEFASTAPGRSIIESCATVLTLRQEEHAADAAVQYFRLTGGCRDFLTNAKPGMGILRLSGAVTAVQVSPAPFEWPYVETNVSA